MGRNNIRGIFANKKITQYSLVFQSMLLIIQVYELSEVFQYMHI